MPRDLLPTLAGQTTKEKRVTMPVHYIYLQCIKCNKVEMLYTGDIYPEEYGDGNWDDIIEVDSCKQCKANQSNE